MRKARLNRESKWYEGDGRWLTVPAGEPVEIVMPAEVPDHETRKLLVANTNRLADQGKAVLIMHIRDWYAVIDHAAVEYDDAHATPRARPVPASSRSATRPATQPAGGRTDGQILPDVRDAGGREVVFERRMPAGSRR